MPIAARCRCGRAIRVKDELAGRRIRCPECSEVLRVPVPEAEIIEEDSEDREEDRRERRPVRRERTETAIEERRRPAPRSRASAEDEDEDEREEEEERRARRKKRRRRRRSEGSWSRASQSSIVVGALMMVGAIAWFVGGLAVGIIFFYPPILFVLGIAAMVRGFMGQD
jgi:hypothetical protein